MKGKEVYEDMCVPLTSKEEVVPDMHGGLRYPIFGGFDFHQVGSPPQPDFTTNVVMLCRNMWISQRRRLDRAEFARGYFFVVGRGPNCRSRQYLCTFFDCTTNMRGIFLFLYGRYATLNSTFHFSQMFHYHIF